MTVTLTFKPEIEAELLVKAQARGMDLERYLQTLIEQDAAPSQEQVLSERERREEAVRRMLEFGEKYHLSLGQPITRELPEADQSSDSLPMGRHPRKVG